MTPFCPFAKDPGGEQQLERSAPAAGPFENPTSAREVAKGSHAPISAPHRLRPETRKPRAMRGFREVGGTGLEPVTPSPDTCGQKMTIRTDAAPLQALRLDTGGHERTTADSSSPGCVDEAWTGPGRARTDAGNAVTAVTAVTFPPCRL
jgi:hypothetical protein